MSGIGSCPSARPAGAIARSTCRWATGPVADARDRLLAINHLMPDRWVPIPSRGVRSTATSATSPARAAVREALSPYAEEATGQLDAANMDGVEKRPRPRIFATLGAESSQVQRDVDGWKCPRRDLVMRAMEIITHTGLARRKLKIGWWSVSHRGKNRDPWMLTQ